MVETGVGRSSDLSIAPFFGVLGDGAITEKFPDAARFEIAWRV